MKNGVAEGVASDSHDTNPNVQIVFLPAHTTSLIQSESMDQGIIATLKAYYCRNTFSKAHETQDTSFFKIKDITSQQYWTENAYNFGKKSKLW